MPDPATDPFARELRIAPVMTGGTSLAVWMGGVTAELYRVLMAPRDVDDPALRIYRSILELTRTTPRIDVVTGTSAGGLNGAIVAAAWHLHLPVDRFMAMREIWLDLGDIDALLRSPNESNPPSLLQGDDYFAPRLRDELVKWTAYRRDYAEERPIDLLVTVTTVRGEPRTRYDDFDQPIGDQHYDHALRFVRADGPDGDRDDFRDDRWIEQVATAARTSASIPGVFEPSFLRVDPTAPEPPVAGRPNFAGHSSFSVSRWAVDGGVLNNLPLGKAIDRIFAQRARREVRRVLLYVMPTPSVPPDPVADSRDDVPSLATVIGGVAGATWSQGIGVDLDRLREHNVRAARQLAGRIARFRRIASDEDDAVDGAPGATSRLYRETRQVWSRYLALRALTSVARMLDTASPALNEPLRAAQVDVEAALREPRATVMPARPAHDGTLAFGNATGDQPWGWGLSSLEQVVAVALGLVASALSLPQPPLGAPETALAEDAAHRDALGAARDRLYDILTRLGAVRRLDDAFWAHAMTDLGRRLQTRTPAEDAGAITADWAVTAYAQWPFGGHRPGAAASPPADIVAALERIALLETGDATHGIDASTTALLTYVRLLGFRVAQCVTRVAHHGRALTARALGEIVPPVIEPLLGLGALVDGLDAMRPGALDNPESFTLSRSEEELVDDLQGLIAQLDLLTPSGTTTAGVLRNLLAMHVLDTAYETGVTTNEQVLELLQISWNAPNELDARAPASKLAGNEAARLGAFLKRSWRANDWMWGRLDGAHRLIALLLDPKRLRQVRATRHDVVTALDALVAAVDEDPTQPFRAQWNEHLPRIRAELEFLDKSEIATPRALPATTKVLAFALQTQIAQEELPVLRDAVELSVRRGGHEGDGGAFRQLYRRMTEATGGVVAARDVPTLLRSARIGEEKASGEIGHDMLTRTAGQAAAVSVKMLTGTHGQVPLLSTVARPLRTPAMVLYGLTRAMTTDSAVARFALASVLAVSGALVGVSLANEDSVPGAVAGIAALVFIVAIALALVRGGAWTAVPALALLLVVALAAAGGSGTRDILGQAGSGVPAWKRWGFTNPVSLTRVLLAIALVAAIVALVHAVRRASSPAAIGGRIVLVVVLAGAVLVTPEVFDAVMLGSVEGSGIKVWLVDAAAWLDERSVVLLAIGLALVGALIGFGADRAARRVASLRRGDR